MFLLSLALLTAGAVAQDFCALSSRHTACPIDKVGCRNIVLLSRLASGHIAHICCRVLVGVLITKLNVDYYVHSIPYGP
jgi:hypothetical protein